LGIFVRSLVGLDREAAKKALAGFLSGKSFASSQIDFTNLIIDHLTSQGVVDPARLYESPFTDLSPTGPDGLFDSKQVSELVSLLNDIMQRASG
jgi:type I restriction enzyme R subunit